MTPALNRFQFGLAACLFVSLLSSPLIAQASTRATAPGAINILDCVRSLQDRSGGECIQAASVATFGALFPYPGRNNSFDPAMRAVVGGGGNNSASEDYATVGGGTFNSASGYYATVGGGASSTALGGWATIGGGFGHAASGGSATIGGGSLNIASRGLATVGGGRNNTASGYHATVGGGRCNTTYGDSATVGGGRGNTAHGRYATIAGGASNSAYGAWATVGGGGLNKASGDFSFAGGWRAKANHYGAFVWGDSVNVDKTSSAGNQFNIYASGGTRIFSNSVASSGVLLAPGGGSWTSVSDRDAKENVEMVDAREILERLASIPISTWNYKAQDDSVRHMGPMAQDFFAAFGLGLGETGIDTIDPDGVALAAIQGLNERLTEKDAEIAALRNEKDAQVAALQARLEKLESALVAIAKD